MEASDNQPEPERDAVRKLRLIFRLLPFLILEVILAFS